MTAPRILQGHDPDYGESGTDLLLTVWPDAMTVALRPGRDDTATRWGAPAHLADASVLRLVRGELDGGRRS